MLSERPPTGRGRQKSDGRLDLDRTFPHAQKISPFQDFVNGFNSEKAEVRRCCFSRQVQ